MAEPVAPMLAAEGGAAAAVAVAHPTPAPPIAIRDAAAAVPAAAVGGGGAVAAGVSQQFKCVSCGDEFDRDGVPHWTCNVDANHELCVNCFGDYLKHCCDHYAVANKVPVRCFIPDCPALVPQHQIQELVLTDFIKERNLWELYLKTQLRVALEGGVSSDQLFLHRGVSHNKRDVAVTCMFCNHYSELYEPVAPDYWDKKQLQIQLEMEKKIEAVRPEITQEADEKFNPQKQKFDELIKKEKKRMIQTVGFEEDYRTLLENISRTAYRMDQMDDFLKEEHIAAQTGLSRPEIEEEVNNGSAQRVVDFIERYGFDFMSDEDWEEWKHCYRFVMFAEKRGEPFRKKMAELSVKSSQIEQDRERFIMNKLKDIQKAYLEDIKLREANTAISQVDENSNPLASAANMVTTQFFVCRNAKCPGAFCLRCESFLEKKDMTKHVCKKDTIEVLYQEVLTVLAENGSRKCPKCGYIGRKDLECTHIKCEKCNQNYCYVCGKPESELEGGLNQHNNWHVYTPESANKCPLYLQYKYGDQPGPDDRLDGDPGICLEKFHEELQRKAISEKRANTDPQLWQEMCYAKFPRGVFGDEVIEKPLEKKEAEPPIVVAARYSFSHGDSKRELDEKEDGDEDKETVDNLPSVDRPHGNSLPAPLSMAPARNASSSISNLFSNAKEKVSTVKKPDCKVQ